MEKLTKYDIIIVENGVCLMKKYLRLLNVFAFGFFFICFSSCMEPTVTHRYINLDDLRNGGNKTEQAYEPYMLECWASYDNFLEIPYIPEESEYRYLYIEWTWKSPEGIQAGLQLVNQEGLQSSETIYSSWQSEWRISDVQCLAGATYYNYEYGMYVDCADDANRLQFFIQDSSYMPTYGIVYIRRVWLTDYFGKDWTIFEANQPYYQQDYYQIDYTDYRNSNCSIMVRNESNTNVVCFKGDPSESTLISGVRAGTSCGLKYNKKLFSYSGDFVLWVITAENYQLYKRGKLDYYDLQKNPFALIYAYYNADSDSNTNLVYTISKNMYAEPYPYLLLNNPTNYNFELRMNGLYGEALVFAGANMVQTKINLQWGDYYIYPVIRKFQKKLGEIVTFFPKQPYSDYPLYLEYSLSNYGDTSFEFNSLQWFDPNAFKDYTTPGSAYVVVYNGNPYTSICLYRGGNSEAAVTSTGGKLINPGRSLVFEVPIIDRYGRTFSYTTLISNWMIGTNASRTYVPEITVEAGKVYFLDVTGDNAYDFRTQWRTNTEGELLADIVSFDDE